MDSRRIVVLEDEALLRDLIANTLEANHFKVATASNVPEAKRLVEVVKPVGAVLDVELGSGPSGFDFAEYLARTAPDIAIVFLTNVPDPRFLGSPLSAMPNMRAYLRKGQLRNAIEVVDALELALMGRSSVKYRHDLDSTRPLAALSRKQLEVLSQVAQGLSNSQIAISRGTSVRAVEGMVTRILEALEITTYGEGNARVEAARAYLKALGNRAVG